MSKARLLPTPPAVRSSKRIEEITVLDVDECPRCALAHRALELRPLRRPSGTFLVDSVRVRLSFWSRCPRTGEPIMHAVAAT